MPSARSLRAHWSTQSSSTQIIGSVPYPSNLLSTAVDGHARMKRQDSQSDCIGSEQAATVDAINACADLAKQAASVTDSDNDKLIEYFKNVDSSNRTTVVGVFNAVASKCSSKSSGLHTTAQMSTTPVKTASLLSKQPPCPLVTRDGNT